MNAWEQQDAVVGEAPAWEQADAVVAPYRPQITRDVVSTPAEKGRNTPEDQVVASTSIGRVLDAFGQGAKAGWGAEPLGLSAESEKALRDNGLWNQWDANRTDLSSAFKAVNEVFLRPAATVADGFLRSIRAGLYSVAGGIGQAAYETGAAETPGRATRDLVALGETILTVTGAAPLGLKPTARAGRAAEPLHAADDAPPVRAQATAEGIPEPIQTAAGPRSAPVASEAVVDKAGNINLNYIAGGEDLKQIIRDTADSPNFNPKSRGPLTWDQVDNLAAETGLNADNIANKAIREGWQAEHIHAARQIMVQTTDEVRALAAKIARGENTDQNLLKLEEARLKQVSAQEVVSGLADEAGRALGVFRRMAGESKEAEAIAGMLKNVGGREGLEDVARKISGINDPAGVSNVLRETMNPTWKDRFLEVWYNVGLLSNPATHIANVASNLSVALYESAVAGASGLVGTARRAITGGTEGARLGDGFASVHGALAGAREGLPAAWQAFRTERTSGTWAVGSDKPMMRAIPSTESGWGGKQVRLAGRALMAEDELFRAIGARQTLHEIAWRTAREEGLKGQAVWDRYGQILANPTPELLAEAAKQGTKAVFQTPLGKGGSMIQGIANEWLAARLIVPFVRTPVNIIKYAGENSPLGIFSQEARANLRGVNGAAKQDEQIARMFLGTMVSTALVSLAVDGTITGGGPTAPAERGVWLLDKKPYHIKVGGYEYDYKRLTGPLGIVLGVVADSKDVAEHMTQGEANKVAALVGASIVKNLVQQTWMSGPADLVKAVSDPDRYGEKWVQRMVASFVTPGIVAQAARIEDPFLKDARTILDAVKARTPVLTRDVAPQRDIFGRKIAADLPLVHAAALQADPVVKELQRLNVFPAKPERKLGGVELTPDQYDRLQATTGRWMKEFLDSQVNGRGWSQMPNFVQVEIIKGSVERARAMGRAELTMGDPSLYKALIDEKMKKFSK